jgi:hypothetical protein
MKSVSNEVYEHYPENLKRQPESVYVYSFVERSRSSSLDERIFQECFALGWTNQTGAIGIAGWQANSGAPGSRPFDRLLRRRQS